MESIRGRACIVSPFDDVLSLRQLALSERAASYINIVLRIAPVRNRIQVCKRRLTYLGA
jgi:hypothetical protein